MTNCRSLPEIAKQMRDRASFASSTSTLAALINGWAEICEEQEKAVVDLLRTVDSAYGVNCKLRKQMKSTKDFNQRLQRGIEKMKQQSAVDHAFAETQKVRIAQLEAENKKLREL